MNQRVKVACLFGMLALATACARAGSVTPVPTRTPKPTFTLAPGTPTATRFSTALSSTGTPQPTVAAPTGTTYATSAARPTNTAGPTARPSDTPKPTDRPVPTATALPCSAGYVPHVNTKVGFSVCYPTGWTVSEGEDAEQNLKWATFNPPTVDPSTGTAVKSLVVATGPVVTGSSQKEVLETIALELIRKYEGKLVGWPRTLGVDGQGAVEVRYEFAWPVVQQGVVTLTGWEVGFVAGDRTWTIGIGGLKEHQAELEAIHGEVLSRFHLLPR